jgi:hypothetical protein
MKFELKVDQIVFNLIVKFKVGSSVNEVNKMSKFEGGDSR